MARRFASSTEQEIEKLLKQKDSENKEDWQKLRRNCSTNTLRKKVFRNWNTRRTQMLKLFAVFCLLVEQCIIKQLLDSVFCDIRNNQGLGKLYQPQPPASADNSYLDLDYSGYRKNLIQ